MGPVNSFMCDIYNGIVTLYHDGALTGKEANLLTIQMAQALTVLGRALAEEQDRDIIPAQYDDRGEEYDYASIADSAFDATIDSYERLGRE